MMALLPPVPAKYKGRLVIGAAAIALFLASTIFGDRGLRHLLRLHEEQRQLETKVFALQHRNDQLQRRIERLQSDDRYIERLARERLGLVKKDELVYRVDK